MSTDVVVPDRAHLPEGSAECTSEYILVCDLPQRVRSLRTSGLKVPDERDPFFVQFHAGLTERLTHALPESRLRVMDMRDLSEDILARAQHLVAEMDKAFIVSSCTEIANPAHGATLEVNRIVDIDGNILGIGARPGHPDLDTQLNAIMHTAAGRSIILMEDGTFTGGTLAEITRRFKNRGAHVAGAVVGFAFPQSLARLRAVFSDEQIHIVEPLNHPVDWVPDHDFFPFMPNCGRVMGFQFNGEPVPFYNYDGSSYTVPYLLPYAPMADWAGLSIDGPELCAFTDFCVASAIELFQRIEKLSERAVMFEDLRRAKPRVGIPISVGQKSLPRMNCSIVDYLRELRVELW